MAETWAAGGSGAGLIMIQETKIRKLAPAVLVGSDYRDEQSSEWAGPWSKTVQQ